MLGCLSYSAHKSNGKYECFNIKIIVKHCKKIILWTSHFAVSHRLSSITAIFFFVENVKNENLNHIVREKNGLNSVKILLSKICVGSGFYYKRKKTKKNLFKAIEKSQIISIAWIAMEVKSS